VKHKVSQVFLEKVHKYEFNYGNRVLKIF
jgi:hypothetical protein